MVGIGALVVLLVVIAVAAGISHRAWNQRSGRRGRSDAAWGTAGSAAVPASPDDEVLVPALDRAVTSGLIGREIADAILRQEHDRAGATLPAPRIPLAAEAVGYVGAAVLILGLMSLVGSVWPDLPIGGRVAILAAAAVVLLGAGIPLDDEVPIEWRLRNVVWGLSIGALAGTAAVLVVDGFDWAGEPSAISIGGAVSVYGAVLWRRRVRPLPQSGTLVGAVVAMAGALAWIDGVGAVGVGISTVGVAWLALAWADRLPPRLSAVALGCAAVLVGPGVAAGTWSTAGPMAGVVLAAALVALGAVAAVLVVTAAGVVGVVVYLPWTLSELFGESAGPGVMQVATGVIMLGAMLVLLRFRRPART